MDSGRRNIIILLGVIAVVLLLYFAWMFRPDGRHNWDELYHHEDEKPQPYSTEVIVDLLDGYFPENDLTVMHKKKLAETLPVDTTGDAAPVNYIFVGERMYLDSADRSTLLRFAEQGNYVFIASKTVPYLLRQEFYKRDCDTLVADEYIGEYEYYYEDKKNIGEEIEYIDGDEYYSDDVMSIDEDSVSFDLEELREIARRTANASMSYNESYNDTIVAMNFTHPKLQRDSAYVFQYVYRNKPGSYNWHYYENNKRLCDSLYGYVQLGYFDDTYPNFIKVPYGEGSFYLHSNPLVFTNYHLLDEDALTYAGNVFSHLHEGDIYWDEKSKDYYEQYPRNQDFSQSPLSYILSQQSLRWAWYLMLSLVLLFVLFRAKRKQRIIPIRAANTNTSLEFIQTIGRLYHLQQDHKGLSEKMMSLFKDFIRRRYGIRIKQADDKDIRLVHIKSEVATTHIEEIFTRYRRMNREDEISESHLTNFYNALERFYQTCK